MRTFAASEIQAKILAAACQLDNQDIQAAKQGKASVQVADDLLHLMLIHEFLPYWKTEEIRQIDCFLNEKFNI